MEEKREKNAGWNRKKQAAGGYCRIQKTQERSGEKIIYKFFTGTPEVLRMFCRKIQHTAGFKH